MATILFLLGVGKARLTGSRPWRVVGCFSVVFWICFVVRLGCCWCVLLFLGMFLGFGFVSAPRILPVYWGAFRFFNKIAYYLSKKRKQRYGHIYLPHSLALGIQRT
jgi:hypothetical protein